MTTEVKTGVTSKGGEVNWKAIEDRRKDDQKITQLFRQGLEVIENVCNGGRIVETIFDITSEKFSLNIFIENFNKFLKEKKVNFAFDILDIDETIETNIKESKKTQLKRRNKRFYQERKKFDLKILKKNKIRK